MALGGLIDNGIVRTRFPFGVRSALILGVIDRHHRRNVAGVAWTVLMVVLLLSPSPATSQVPWPHLDKVVHALLFGVYASLWLRPGRAGSVWAVGASGIALGLVTEGLQPHLPWPREGDLWDFVADLVGLALGLLAAWMVLRNGRDSNPR